MERCSTSLLLEKWKSKLQWVIASYQSEWPFEKEKKLWTINAGKDVEKREPSYTVGGNVNWYSHYREQYGDFFKKLGINLSYAIPLPGIYPKKTTTLKDACTPIPIAALFTIARTWKPPRCPSTDKWIKTMWYIYTVEYNWTLKKNESESVQVR